MNNPTFADRLAVVDNRDFFNWYQSHGFTVFRPNTTISFGFLTSLPGE